ncbi:IS5 family transposase [Streptomyces sp. NPDC088254]|uniref:IS5 family transposase n=1 Tax=Streptomyces sp. NPDC088254 TaxID=3365847 RepID=UPI00381D5490
MTAWCRLQDWTEAGVWPRLHAALLTELRRAGLLDLDDCSVDGSTSGHSKGGPHRPLTRRPRPPRLQAPPDRRRHGTPLAVTLTGGNRHDITQFLPLLDAVPPIRGLRGRPHHRPRRLYADRGYDFDRYRRLLWRRGVKPLIARRGVAHGSGRGKVRRVVERAFAWLHQFQRLRTRYERRADLHQACSNWPAASYACAAYVPHPEVISWLSVLIPAAPELPNVEISTRSLVPNAPASGLGTPEMSGCFTYGGH